MRQSLTIIDNFLADPLVVRKFALEHDFSTVNEMDGHKYPGTCRPKHPGFEPWLERMLSAAIGATAKIKICAFVSSKEGELTEQWIHADSICSKHAAVCYLFDGHHEHGTAFWRHKESGANELEAPMLESLGVDADDEFQLEAFAAKVRAEGEDAESWTMTDFAEARLGRLITFRSKSFHSRFPRHAFGDSPETSRLVLVIFFDIL